MDAHRPRYRDREESRFHWRDIDFYARHGFRVTRELRLPRGPKMWAMWRDPRA